MTLTELQSYSTTKRTELNLKLKDIAEKKVLLEDIRDSQENHVKAKWLLSEAQILTQTKFKTIVEGLVTKAIQAVYPRDFKFILDFERARNKLECTPRLQEGDTMYNDIRDCQGGGLVDIIAFSFRLVLWHLMNPRSRNTIVLDEPFRFLGEFTEKAGQMLKEVSHKLGLQIIMITHEDCLAELADRSFHMTYKGIYSTVTQRNHTRDEKHDIIDTKEEKPLVLTRRKK